MDDRGALPFALVHGESLVASASFALEHAGVELVDFTVGWQELRESGRPLVLHDPLCPLTPPDFVAEATRVGVESGEVVVGVRPVTDTLKQVDGQGEVGGTVDRDAHVLVCSPIVLPAPVVAALVDPPDTADFASLAATLRERFGVRLLPAPPLARRVRDEDELTVLESLSEATGGPGGS